VNMKDVDPLTIMPHTIASTGCTTFPKPLPVSRFLRRSKSRTWLRSSLHQRRREQFDDFTRSSAARRPCVRRARRGGRDRGVPVSPRAWATTADAQTALAALGSGAPQPGKVTIGAPEIAENGNTVPIVIDVESPMTMRTT